MTTENTIVPTVDEILNRFAVVGKGKTWTVSLDGEQVAQTTTKTAAKAEALAQAVDLQAQAQADAKAAEAASKLTADVIVDIAGMDKAERLNAAKAERTAVKAAEDAGEPQPPTPVLDWMRAGKPGGDGKAAKASKATGIAGSGREKITDADLTDWVARFYADDPTARPQKVLDVLRAVGGKACSYGRMLDACEARVPGITAGIKRPEEYRKAS